MSVYIIAELGINHNGSLELARQLIDAAKAAGADAVKFQKRTVELVYTAEELAKPRESPWGTTTRAQKLGLELSSDDYEAIDRQCGEIGMAWSASAWDVPSVRFLDRFDLPWLKIPSALLTDHKLLRAYVTTGRPLILSTGMSTWEEIDAAVHVISPDVLGHDWTVVPSKMPRTGVPLTLLHCHSSYPSPLDELNLACIRSLLDRYGLPVGYSSHSVSPWPCLMAACFGAEVIEAHLTLDRTLYGSDQAASLEPAAFAKMVEEIRTMEQARGDGVKRVYPSEEPVKAKLRR